MDHACPNCKCEECELLPSAFQTAIASLPARPTLDLMREALGLRHGRKVPRDAKLAFFQKVAPPQRISYFPILGWWFVATLALTVVPTTVGTLAGYAVLVAAGFALNKVYRFNTDKLPLLFQKWEQSYICSRCGTIFNRG